MVWVADRKARLPDVMATLSEFFEPFTAVIVTGGSSGIGKSFIKLVGNVKPELVVCNLSRCHPDIKSVALKLHHIAIDLSEPARIEFAAEEALRWLGREAPVGKVLFINNSGFGGYGIFPEPDLAHQLGMINVNIRAGVELTGRLLPMLKARGGAIVNVASTAAFQPTAYMAVYGATKAFVLHWSLALNEELRGTGVRALAVCPGPTATEFFRRAGLEAGSVADQLSMSSEAVALAALRALANGRSVVVTGWTNKIGAFLVTKLPKPLATSLTARVLARFRLKRVVR
ncbi:MAG: SDR family NAD(P)-dependent oxidoreductase [Opitutales bacterium]